MRLGPCIGADKQQTRPMIRSKQDFEERVLPGPDGLGGEEGLHLEFKKGPDSGKSAHRATALDLAAFANSVGGVVVFGVAEDPTRPKFAGSIVGLLDVPTCVKHVEDAITNWTHGFEERPRPEPLDVDGGRVVVVNVFPSGRLVSVRGHKEQQSVAYPFRHAHGNDYLKPEEVAHRLDTRRGFSTRNQLRQWLREPYPPGGPRPIHLFYLETSYARSNDPRWTHSKWQESKYGRVTLDDTMPGGARLGFHLPQGPACFTIPYEWIVSVWWNGDMPAVQVAAMLTVGEQMVQGHPVPW